MKVAINGFGRIGRQVFKIAHEKGIEITHINDLVDPKTLAHLLKYDSTYGRYDRPIDVVGDYIVVDEYRVKALSEKDPSNFKWGEWGVDLVVEATGKFRHYEKAYKHIEAGAKWVIITAPAKDRADITVVYGANHNRINPKEHRVISAASCTTNAFALMIKVLKEKFGIRYGLMTTVHGYTNDQRLLDAPHKNLRRARAAALSIVPTTTGAAKTIYEIYPELEGKLDAVALRVPVPVPSIVDFTVQLEKKPTLDEIHEAYEEASNGELRDLLGITYEELVSIDFKGECRTVVIDAPLTRYVKDTGMYKIFGWYDNEWGYSCRVVDIIEYVRE
ncbi:MAG: type I glyceraldehyde-3-phosphate dehydrogenase [Thermotogae bacterium]|nr:type I glyceraldehyde-3-phosphate dehydrogenase [Thermotogota bacterium]